VERQLAITCILCNACQCSPTFYWPVRCTQWWV